MEYYPALKRKETLPHATPWVTLEDMLLSDISQSQEDKHCVTAPCEALRLRDGEQDAVCRGGGRGCGGGGGADGRMCDRDGSDGSVLPDENWWSCSLRNNADALDTTKLHVLKNG